MKIAVVAYSLTGNNAQLAQSVAQKINAEYIRATEAKQRTTGTIMQDLVFGKTPRTQPETLGSYDLVLFFGPVWCGQVATPLRGYLKLMPNSACRYAFCSISGGADGSNPKLAAELKKLTDREPNAVVDLHIADLLPKCPKPTRKITSAYSISPSEADMLADKIIHAIKVF